MSSNATRAEIARLEKLLGRRPKLLVGELGVEGHSALAEQLALKARDAGFDVVYESERATAEQVVVSAIEEGVHAIGLALPEGGPGPAQAQLEQLARAAGLGGLPIVLGHSAQQVQEAAFLDRLVGLVAPPG